MCVVLPYATFRFVYGIEYFVFNSAYVSQTIFKVYYFYTYYIIILVYSCIDMYITDSSGYYILI
jgi:hypothetical protein